MAKNLGRNVLLSGVSWFVPSVVALIAVPITIRGLGSMAYGVIAMAGAVAGYMGVLDLGLAQGVVRFLSVFVALRNGRAMRQLLVRVLAWFAAAGVVGTALTWVMAPWLASALLKVPPALLDQSVAAFRLGGAAFGVGLLVSVLVLIPQAMLRYDLVSSIGVATGTATLAGPAVLVSLGYGLVPVMWFSFIANVVSCAIWGAVAFRLVGKLPDEGPDLSTYWKDFLGFSLKNGINRVWSLVQTPTSQLVVGISGGVTAAAYFQVPMQITAKVTGLLYQMSTVLLPTGSQMAAEGNHAELLALYERSSRLFFVLNASVVAAVAAFSEPLLLHWLGGRIGAEFATAGAVAFSLLTLAVGLNAVSMTASQVNMALNRPGVNLFFSLANSAINLLTVYPLTVMYGITGTALSGLLAAAVVPFFLHYSHRRVLEYSTWQVFRDCYLRTTVAVTAVGAVSWFLLRPLATGLLVTLLLVAVATVGGMLASAALGAVTREDWTSLRAAVWSKARGDAGAGSDTEPDGQDAPR